jgi:hypothetical protein
VTIGARGGAFAGLVLLAVVLVSTPAAAAAPERSGRAAINIVMDAPCAPALRDVIADQLADLTTEIAWTCRDRFDPEAALRPAMPGESGLRVWIDLRVATEARLTLGDEGADRFVVRRIPLAHGLDELGREQIGQIVRFATLAVRAGESETLTRTAARAAVADWAASPPRPQEDTRAVRADAAPRQPRLSVDIGAIWSLQAFAREIPLVHELALAASVGRATSALSAWMEAAYRLPASDRADPIGVELDAAALRLGIAAGQPATRFAAVGIAAGVGLQRISFTPVGVASSVEPAAAGTFWSATARLSVAVAVRVTAHLTVGARISGELAAADIHYDLRDASGAPHRVMTPFRVAPGLGVGLSWRL